MNILYSTQAVVEYDGSHYYSNAVQSTYKRYCNEGDNITIICYVKLVESPTQNKIDDPRIKFEFVKKINSLSALFKGYSNKNLETVRNKVEKADVCFIHVPSSHGTQAVKCARSMGKPYMTVVTGCPWDTLWTYDIRGKFVAPFSYYSLKKIQNNAQWSIYVTNRFLQKRYPTKGRYIGCSNVDISTGDENALNKRLNRIKTDKQIIRIGTVGAVNVPYKGQEYVIQAVSQLRKEGYNFEYHLYGGGDYARLLSIAKLYHVADYVAFHGAIPHNQILSAFDDMDIYAHPSKTEGLPRALVEAESRGCLCIGSEVGGIPELLDKDFLFPVANVSKICEILRKVNDQTLHEQAIRNFEFAKEFDRNYLNTKRQQFINDFRRASNETL